jgi:hypothetical protein
MSVENYHNALRHSLIRQIKDIKAKHILPYKGEVWENYVILSEFLTMVESFSAQDFNNEVELASHKSLIIDYLEKDLVSTMEIQSSQARIFKFIQAIDKQIKIDLKQANQLPQVPHRKALSKQEWEWVWQNFNQHLRKNKTQSYLDVEGKEFSQISTIICQRAESVYYVGELGHRFALELSGQWFSEMYVGDMFYWIDKNFDWAIYAAPHGYADVYGIL